MKLSTASNFLSIIKIFPVIAATTILPLTLAFAAPDVQAGEPKRDPKGGIKSLTSEPKEGIDTPRLPKCKKGQRKGCTTM